MSKRRKARARREQLGPDVVLHGGDCLHVLPELEPASFGVVLTDPPYSSGAAQVGRSAPALHKYVSTNSSARKSGLDFPGDQRDQRSFITWATMWMASARMLTRTGGKIMVFSDWRQLPAVTDAVQAAGWTWSAVVPWNKKAGRPNRGAFRRQCEFLVYAVNGQPDAMSDRPEVYLPGLLTGGPVPTARRRHITEKPVNILRELLTLAPGERVLDPFAGSGSTMEAAMLNGNPITMVEMLAENGRIIRERHKQIRAQLKEPTP